MDKEAVDMLGRQFGRRTQSSIGCRSVRHAFHNRWDTPPRSLPAGRPAKNAIENVSTSGSPVPRHPWPHDKTLARSSKLSPSARPSCSGSRPIPPDTSSLRGLRTVHHSKIAASPAVVNLQSRANQRAAQRSRPTARLATPPITPIRIAIP